MAEQEQEIGGPGTAVAIPEQRQVTRVVSRGQLGLLRPIAPVGEIIEAQNETRKFIHTALVDGRDYGVIPGTDRGTGQNKKPRKSMFKAGAERVNAAFGVVAEFDIVESEIDHDRPVEWEKEKWGSERGVKVLTTGTSKGLYRYVYRCRLYKGDVLVGEGIGSCSTMENKYVDRPRDLENTVVKMAKKRAFVDATLTTFGLSDEFTQDYEDEDDDRAQAQRAATQERAATNVQGQVQQAMDRLGEIQKGKGKKAPKPTTPDDEAEATALYQEMSAGWNRRGLTDQQRMDEATQALIGDEIQRYENGVPNIEIIPAWALRKIVELGASKEAAKAEAAAAKKPAQPTVSDQDKLQMLSPRKVGKTIHLMDPSEQSKECIGCGEPLMGQKTAESEDPTAYCPKALSKVSGYAEDRVPEAVRKAASAA